MSKVNTPPRGLQDLLGNVNQGVNPSELNQTVNPGVDMLPFWGLNKTESRVQSAQVSGVIGMGTTLAVPEGEAWILVAASAQYFVPVGETRTISLRMTNASGGFAVIIGRQARLTATTAVAEVCTGMTFDKRFILPPSWGLRGQVDESSIATISTMSLTVHFYKIRV